MLANKKDDEKLEMPNVVKKMLANINTNTKIKILKLVKNIINRK